MDVNFFSQQNEIKDFIETNYKDYMLDGLSPPQAYVDDFLDLDKYRQDFSLFFNFSSYTFERETNISENQETVLTVFLVVRNDDGDMLREKLLKYATSFYKFFDDTDRNFGGLVDYGKIESLTFFNAAEGQKNVKVAQVDIVLHNEL
jgi:hypothetical protein